MTVRVMISMPAGFLAQVDARAAQEHRGRSELIREALRRYMAPEQTRSGVARVAAELAPLDSP